VNLVVTYNQFNVLLFDLDLLELLFLGYSQFVLLVSLVAKLFYGLKIEIKVSMIF